MDEELGCQIKGRNCGVEGRAIGREQGSGSTLIERWGLG